MSIIKGAKYVCDRCGKEAFVEQTREEIKEKPGSFIVRCPKPVGWDSYHNGEELLCDECVANIPQTN